MPQFLWQRKRHIDEIEKIRVVCYADALTTSVSFYEAGEKFSRDF